LFSLRLIGFALLREMLSFLRGLWGNRSVGDVQYKMKSVNTYQRQWGKDWILAMALTSLLAPCVWAAQAKPLSVLEGKLLTTRGDCPLLKINGREQGLSANTPYLLATLQDKRLDGRDVRLEGIAKPDGSFEVNWLYTVHNGRLFRVRYFCATCNIVALGPGNCVCCQQPTELQEIPKEKSDS
jgi:hypothetical protein